MPISYLNGFKKALIKSHLSRIEEINEKIKEICKTTLDTGECGFDEQKSESNKFRYGINKRLSESNTFH